MAKPARVGGKTPLPSSPVVILHFDGACAPNPGPMGIGYVLSIKATEEQGSAGVLAYGGSQPGAGTNNKAEYMALLAGLRHALRLGVWDIEVRSDSMLVVQQVKGKWRVSGALRRLHYEATTLLSLFNSWTISHIPREKNTAADELSHQTCEYGPPLPSIPRGSSNLDRKLYDWQAAAIRVWWLSGRCRSEPLIARIFGVSDSTVGGIARGLSYTQADFSGTPDLSTYPTTAGHMASV